MIFQTSLPVGYVSFKECTPRKIHMEPKIHPIEIRKIIFQTIIFRFHMGVSLNGGTPKTPQNDHF